MPLSPEWTGTYVVRFGFMERVEPVSVTRRLSVADMPGYELAGPLGVSRLAWRDGVLYADETANAFFTPPIPLLAEDGQPRKWHGTVISMGKSHEATAELVQSNDKERNRVDIGGRIVPATLATLTLQLGAQAVVLESWYQPGTGLVQQVQRTNRKQVTQLQIVSPPHE